MELIFASHNENKVKEIRKLFPTDIKILSLNDIHFHEEIIETGVTLEDNAQLKAQAIFDLTGKNVFADDTGLFVEALDGDPGVYSSRYAGTGKDEDNIQKLLQNLNEISNRKAYFKTAICLILHGETHFLEGKVYGEITREPKGAEGFGYDPVFRPDGFSTTFAEMNLEEKNKISHRSNAVSQLIKFITNK